MPLRVATSCSLQPEAGFLVGWLYVYVTDMHVCMPVCVGSLIYGCDVLLCHVFFEEKQTRELRSRLITNSQQWPSSLRLQVGYMGSI